MNKKNKTREGSRGGADSRKQSAPKMLPRAKIDPIQNPKKEESK